MVTPARRSSRPRPPSGRKTRRQSETDSWRANWEAFHKQELANTKAKHAQFSAGRSKTYQHLWRIYEATQSEVLAAALFELTIYGLDRPHWRAVLRRIESTESGGSQNAIAVGFMKLALSDPSMSVNRAAQMIVGAYGLFRRATSFEAACQAARGAWYARDQQLIALASPNYRVLPNKASLKDGEVRQLRDPKTMRLLTDKGLIVEDSYYWRNAASRGFVVIEPRHKAATRPAAARRAR